MNRTFVHVGILSLAAHVSMVASAGAPVGYAAHRTITFTGYEGTTPLTNFPVLVKLPASYFRTASRKDVAFTDSAGNRIPHEVDWYNGSEVPVWVRVPELSGTTTSITAYFGKGVVDVTDFTVVDVWTNAYAAVWHLNADATDSTGHGLAQTARNANHVSVVAAESSPLVGRSLKLDGNNEAGLLFETPKSTFIDQCISDVSKITVTGWFKPKNQTHGSKAMRLLCWKADSAQAGFDTFQNTNGKFYMRGNNKNVSWITAAVMPWTAESWAHLAARFDGTTFAAYLNGAALSAASDVGTSAVTVGDGSNVARMGFGNMGAYADGSAHSDYQYPFDGGQLDELRIYNGVASADWIKAEHDTVAKAGFASYGDIVETAAANGTWISASTIGSWADGGCWQDGVVPYGDESVVTFASPGEDLAQTVVMNGSVVVKSIVQSDSATRTISSGMFAFTSPASVSVAEGGRLELSGAVLTNGLEKTGLGTLGIDVAEKTGGAYAGTISVASGTFSFLPTWVADPELVADGGFEPTEDLPGGQARQADKRSVTDKTYLQSNLPGWVFGPSDSDGSGICSSDSFFSVDEQITSNGEGNKHAAFLRHTGSAGPGQISREIVTERANTEVTVEFQFNTRWYKGNGAYDYWRAQVEVYFDGTCVLTTDPLVSPHKNSGDASYKTWRTASITFNVPLAGAHTLAFKAVKPIIDNVTYECDALIDNVKVGMTRAATGRQVRLENLTLDIAAGAKLNLAEGVDVRVKEVRYNGVKLQGTITAESHPEFVTGTGCVRSAGLVVIVF